MRDDVSRPAEITVAVPARLHLGFLDLNGGLGRKFGGIGLAISDFGTSLSIRRAKHTRVSGPESDRVQEYLGKMERALALDSAHAVNVLQNAPTHSGLGSGTQLALAVASGIRRLHNLPLQIEEDALRLGRGARSGIGIGLFHRGGVVVDGGHGSQLGVAPIISHLPFPEYWRVLVIFDRQRRGVHGVDEVSAFADLAPMREADAARICRLVLMNVLPALVEHDIGSFGAAIKELQARLGDYFARAQGGRAFTSPAVAGVLERLDTAGAHGIGQSSWGPTGFAFVPSAEDAERLAKFAREHPTAEGLDIRICSGLNRGAAIVAQMQA
ncbi:MAG TPA: beta-ribofuranosylaminobenzene 5'-phosphate synthase family protein [Xanthobacteraceae bacterium]